MKDEFYIGYLPKASNSYKKKIRLFIGVLMIAIPALAYILVGNQNGFPTSTFELGKLTTLEGVLTTEPVPMLKILHGRDHQGAPVYQSVLLIGFGKFGAENAIEAMEKAEGKTLEGYRVKLEGTLIYHDGKTLLELTKDAAALKEVGEIARSQFQNEIIGQHTFEGEIMDSKCFFGVMKPGEGKPHRSCAIRCISGGNPPVLRTTSEQGQTQYFIVLGDVGEPINRQILPYVGMPVELKGNVIRYDDWYVLRTDMDNDIRKLGFMLSSGTPLCNDTKLLGQKSD